MAKDGDAQAQRNAREYMREGLETKIGLSSGVLKNKRIAINNSYLEVEGYCNTPNIICEFSARIGNMKSAQTHKVMNDALKLLFVEKYEGKHFRKIIVFIDENAAKKFMGDGWHGECLRKCGIEIIVVDVPEGIKDDIRDAILRQYR